jgi:NAD(P)-dependent dehydrogenase (short-subunit alcohol dehydrogenase family)
LVQFELSTITYSAIMPPNSNAPVVLVTGAAKRLGREIALALAAGGWRVAVHYRSSKSNAIDTVAYCARIQGDSDLFDADLGDEKAVKRLFSQAVERFGQVDAVVNSASTFEQDDAASFGFASFEKHLRSNTAAPILLAQALHTHLVNRNAPGETTVRGAVVNLLDQKLWNQNPDFLSYTLSKAALEAANTMLAMALAPLVRVVGVAPGLTLTSHLLTDAQFEALHKLSPLGRSSTPADVAATVKFALENQSITGTTLLVDGGQHLMKFERDFSLMKP